VASTLNLDLAAMGILAATSLDLVKDSISARGSNSGYRRASSAPSMLDCSRRRASTERLLLYILNTMFDSFEDFDIQN